MGDDISRKKKKKKKVFLAWKLKVARLDNLSWEWFMVVQNSENLFQALAEN